MFEIVGGLLIGGALLYGIGWLLGKIGGVKDPGKYSDLPRSYRDGQRGP